MAMPTVISTFSVHIFVIVRVNDMLRLIGKYYCGSWGDGYGDGYRDGYDDR